MSLEPESLDDEALRRLGRQVSIRELLVWLVAVSVAFALPHWLGLSALPIVFYGWLVALSWRLAKAVSPRWALGLAFFFAFGLTCFVMLAIQPT